MDWEVEYLSDGSRIEVKENLQLVRETLEAKLKAEGGHYGEAARILWELVVQVRRAKNRRAECVTLVHMGKVYRMLRWSIAVQLFEEALELAEASDFAQGQVMALVELGELRCHWGEFHESLELFARAMALAEQGDEAFRRVILLNMVIVHEGLDELERCRELLAQVIEIDRRIGSEEIEEDLAHLVRLGGQDSAGGGGSWR